MVIYQKLNVFLSKFQLLALPCGVNKNVNYKSGEKNNFDI